MVKLKTPSGPPPICISKERPYHAEQPSCLTRQLKNVPLRQKLRTKVKSKSKCMETVWEKMFNFFQDYATVELKFDLSQSCIARRAACFY